MGWNAVATLSLQGATFLSSLLVANIVGAESFGQFGLVVGAATATAAVLQFSTGIAATRYLSRFRRSKRRHASFALGLCARVSLTLGGLGTLGLLLLAGQIASHLLAAPELSTALAISAPIVLFSVLVGFQMGALVGFESFKRPGIAFALLLPLQVGVTAAAASAYGLVGAVVGTVLMLGVRTIVCGLMLRHEANAQGIRFDMRLGRFSRNALVRFLLPGSLSGLTAMPALWIATAHLSRTSGGFEQVAFFNAAYAVRGVFLIFPWILSGVALALLSRSIGERSKQDFRLILGANLAVTLVIVAVGCLIVFLWGDLLLGLYGASFAAGFSILKVLMISSIAEAIALPLLQALTSRGRMWPLFLLVILPRDLLLVIVAFMLMDSSGALGLSIAHVAAFGFALAALAVVWRYAR